MRGRSFQAIYFMIWPLICSLYVFHGSFLPSFDQGATLSSRSVPSTTRAPPLTRQPASSSTSYKLAYQESLGFFTDITDEHWHMMKSQARRTKQYSGYDRFGSSQPNIWLVDNIFPIFVCPFLQRVGGHLLSGQVRGDGPKWTCDVHRYAEKKDCLVYSIGSQGVYTWEDALVELLDKNCEIHVFDPGNFAREDDPEKNRIHYHRYGLKSSYDKDYIIVDGDNNEISNMKTFQEIQAELMHEGRRIDLFKIDCEGCEWHTIQDWIGANIQQILIETHGLPHPHAASRYLMKSKLNAEEYFNLFVDNGFALFSKELNGYSQGDCIEWSYLKMSDDFWKDVRPGIQNSRGDWRPPPLRFSAALDSDDDQAGHSLQNLRFGGMFPDLKTKRKYTFTPQGSGIKELEAHGARIISQGNK